MISKAYRLKMCLTAGIGSDHVDLAAACARNITVAEVTFCNSISVAEHVVMMILALVRNYIPAYKIVMDGGSGGEAPASRVNGPSRLLLACLHACLLGNKNTKRKGPTA